MLWSPNIQVFCVIVYDPNTNALTISITINIKDESIKTIALINCRVEGTFIHKKTSKTTPTINLCTK